MPKNTPVPVSEGDIGPFCALMRKNGMHSTSAKNWILVFISRLVVASELYKPVNSSSPQNYDISAYMQFLNATFEICGYLIIVKTTELKKSELTDLWGVMLHLK
jgi:hypothetical protein